jgi:hypothetical protein
MPVLHVRTFWVALIVLCTLMVSALLFAARTPRLMLFQHGTPEVPGGHAFAIMNPFRNRRPEEVAEQLISDLRTDHCQQILRDLHSDDGRICPILREDSSASLIWRQDGESVRVLVYDLPRTKSRLWITSSRDEPGFIVREISLIR